MTDDNGMTIRGASLRTKVLIPFFVILLALGTAATVGTILIITETLKKTADERLTSLQQQVFSEFRELEERVLRRTKLLEVSYRIDESLHGKIDGDLGNLEQLIDESLFAEGMSARFISPRALEAFPDDKLARLVDLSRISGKPQIRLTTDIGPKPALTIVRPLYIKNRIVQYIVIQADMDEDYLRDISEPLNLRTALFDVNRRYLSSSDSGRDYHPPSDEDLARVLDGQLVFRTSDDLFKSRNLYYAVPLGTTDMLIVMLEMPLADISSIVRTLATRSGLSILLAMVIGGLIYYRVISQIMAPAQSMLHATQAIGEGNLNYRIDDIPAGELGDMLHSFNDMMQKISDLYEERLEKDRELMLAQEELKYKDILEEKNRAIEHANLEMSDHLQELSTLLQLNQAMASTLDLDVLFDRVINSLSDLLECSMVILMLYDNAKESLEISQTHGIDRSLLSDISFDLSEGISGQTARTRNLVYIRDLKADDSFLDYKGKLPADGSLLSVPLLSKDRLCGVLNLHKTDINGFDENDIKISRAVSNQLAVAIENTLLYEQAKTQSITDELTGLSNRRHFHDIFQREIVHAQRYSSNLSMIMVDIDHFKKYNDTHGHLQGDIALKKVAGILLQNTRGIDLVARFGGEEFVILLPKTSVAGARTTAEKLRDIVQAEHFSGEESSQPGGTMTISLGAATYPDHTSHMESLLDLADQALYRAKDSGRNRVTIWDEDLQSTA